MPNPPHIHWDPVDLVDPVPKRNDHCIGLLTQIMPHFCYFPAHQLPTSWPRNPNISRYLTPSSSEIGMTASTSCLPLLWIGRGQQEGQGHGTCVCTNHCVISTRPESATRHTLNINQSIKLDNMFLCIWTTGFLGRHQQKSILKSMSFKEEQSRIQPKFHESAPWQSARWRHLPRAIERILHLLSNLWQQ